MSMYTPSMPVARIVRSSMRMRSWNFGASPHIQACRCFVYGLNIVHLTLPSRRTMVLSSPPSAHCASSQSQSMPFV